MSNAIDFFCKAGYAYDAAVVLAECFEYDHPAVRIKAEPRRETDNERMEILQSESRRAED